jgi:hypothetical protein
VIQYVNCRESCQQRSEAETVKKQREHGLVEVQKIAKVQTRNQLLAGDKLQESHNQQIY